MPKSKPKPTVIVTNPRASRLPRQLGTFSPSPPPLAPITPKQLPASRQLSPGPRVVVTNPRAGGV